MRARILNVPLPESGHRFGDIVPHDGAPTGFRVDDDGSKVAVLNELERLKPSAFQTLVVFLSCVRRDDLQALLDLTAPGLGYAKDWTESVRYYCLRCSFGTPHRHDAPKAGDWQPDRNLGIAAQSRKSVEKLLKVWVAKGSMRSIDGIASRECKLPERANGHVWWRGPYDEDSEKNDSNCPAADDSIDPKRYPLFMARAVMRSLVDELLAGRSPCPPAPSRASSSAAC